MALEAAYGLAITITMLMTSILVTFWLNGKKKPFWFIPVFALTYFTIEGSFLVTSMNKFTHGGLFWLVLFCLL